MKKPRQNIEGSKSVYEIRTEKDLFIPMRDKVRLSADIHRPDADGKFPALIAFQPFGKDHEEMALRFPPQARPSHLWDGNLESGNTYYLVSRGYGHVIVDARGTGSSEGEFYGPLGVGEGEEGNDLYDVIEWVAKQPWCDGNIGMIGVSYLATSQVVAAAEQAPHLKAIFCEGGHYDSYAHRYHGGIMWLMTRAVIEGRGGDGSYAVAVKNHKSIMMTKLSKEEFESRIQERLMDPDVRNYPNFHQILKYPETHPMWLDFILNPCDGPFYWKAAAYRRLNEVKIPAHFGAAFGRGWVIDETIKAYQQFKAPKKLVLRSAPPMQERPFHQYHDEIVRWYDHWLKGIDTGVMDEPPIKVFVHGINEWHHEHEWPLARTQWTKFYLRSRKRLLTEPEPFDADSVPPDGFYQPPLFVTDDVLSVTYRSPALHQDTKVIGPCAVYLYATIDTEDTNWIVRISDVDPQGKAAQLTTGWLKASHRELDQNKSEPWAPHHPHTRSVPVVPGELYEYAIKIYPISNVFKKGHRIELEIRSIEDPNDPALGVLPPDSFHLNSGRATFHKIYRDRENQSYLVLPLIP